MLLYTQNAFQNFSAFFDDYRDIQISSLSSSKHFFEHYSVVICHFGGISWTLSGWFDKRQAELLFFINNAKY